MNEEDNRKRKIYLLIVVALLIAFLAFSLAQNAQNTADINNMFVPVPNNTNLAPDFSGIDPTVPFGTGERIQNVTYNATNYTLDLHVFAHAMSVSDTAAVKVYIDGVLVSPRSGRPLGAAETAYRGADITIPKNSSYLVNITNYHHYEWREYPILSGKNGTLSLNQTFITTGSSFNATYDQTTKVFDSNYSAQTFPNASIYGLVDVLNSSKVNKTGDNMTGLLNAGAGINTSFLYVRGDHRGESFNFSVPSDSINPYFMELNGTDGVTISIKTLQTISTAFANFRTEAESNVIQFTSHSSARTSSRFGVTVGGWSEIVNTNGASGNTNGMIIGTTANKPLLFGTNSLGRMNITADGNITVLTAGKGFVLKSGGTPPACAFVNLSDAGALMTTSISC